MIRRQPFVWQVELQREVLEQEVAQLSELPYSLWREIIDVPMRRELAGRDGRSHILRIEATWLHRGAAEIRVDVTIRRAGLHLLPALGESFVITPDSRVTRRPSA